MHNISCAVLGRSRRTVHIVGVGEAKPLHVMFLNTRSGLGADVAVHLTIMRSLDPARCRVTFVTNSRASDLHKILGPVRAVPNVKTVLMNLGDEVSGASTLVRRMHAARAAVVMCAALIRLVLMVRSTRVDIIHSTDRTRDALLSTLVSMFGGCRNILHMHIKWGSDFGRIAKWAMERCSATLAISNYIRSTLVDGGVPTEKIYTALNATDPTEFDPARASAGVLRVKFDIPADAPIVGLVGRVLLWKGHLDMVEALPAIKRQCPEVRLVFVGFEADPAEPFTKQVNARAEELGVRANLIWAGWLSPTVDAYADFDVTCVPSAEEPFGLVVTEAMAMSKPVVAYASGALPEIITDGVDGCLVPPGDTHALAARVVDLLGNGAKRVAMGAKARQTVLERFTPERQAREVCDIYYAVCRPHVSAPAG